MSSPSPSATDRATRERTRFLKSARDGETTAARARLLERGGDLLDRVFDASPYLTGLVHAEPGTVSATLEEGAEAVIAREFAALDRLEIDERGAALAALRRAKRRVALALGLADVAGAIDERAVTAALSDLADRCVDAVLRLVFKFAVDRGEVEASVFATPARHGLFVLGMGKYGARELNYSSDIDLVVFFDPERLPYTGRESPNALAAKVTRSLAQLLEENGRDGYVFRTDLRLRPFPAGQPLALTVDAAETYYARHGQNWERAAFIKARAVAGDLEAGAAFLERLAPFIWRRSLDFAAINDIHSIKRQIHAFRGHARIATRGHNVKLGRGGIREIEFFCQTQQLILGGRVPSLRERATTPALEQLAATGWIDRTVAGELIAAYWYLRRVEHRLQMIDDAQTHLLPADDADFARVAVFLGYADGAAFERELRGWLETVERHYAGLFETSPDLSDAAALVFTGTEDDPATLEHLARMGFGEPAVVSTRVRGWHHGHIAATRSARARELLTELMPDLLHALADQRDPDAAFRRFDAFLASLPAGVQLFSLFYANPQLLRLIALIMGTAPRLAERLAGSTRLFEAMLTPDFIEQLPARDALAAELDDTLAAARSTEDLFDRARVWAQARQFQVEFLVLTARVSAHGGLDQLTAIADLLLERLLGPVEDWLAETHGRVPGGRFAVVAMGKLGSRELTIGSDLDLVFVFDAALDARSDGPKPVAAATYYARLSQRVISALTAPTAEGRLFEIDMRLRPSGNAGPVACSLASFDGYQRRTAQVWEHQALTRARAVAGDPGLCGELEAIIEDVLTAARDADALARDVAAMRARVFREHGKRTPFELKHHPGGVVTMEFLAQYLVLAHAAAHPSLLHRKTEGVFHEAGRLGLLDGGEAARLVRALRLNHALAAVVRVTVDARFDPAAAPEAVQAALLAAAQAALEDDQACIDTTTLTRELEADEAEVAALFARRVGPFLPEETRPATS